MTMTLTETQDCLPHAASCLYCDDSRNHRLQQPFTKITASISLLTVVLMGSAAILKLAALQLTLARIGFLLALELFRLTARTLHSLLSLPLLLLGHLPQVNITIPWPAQRKDVSFTFENGVFEGPTLEVDPAEPYEDCEGDTVPAVLLLHSPGESRKLQVLQRGLSGIALRRRPLNEEELSREEAYAPQYVQIVNGIAVQPCATMIPAYTTEPLELPKRRSPSRIPSIKRRGPRKSLSRKGSFSASRKAAIGDERWQ